MTEYLREGLTLYTLGGALAVSALWLGAYYTLTGPRMRGLRRFFGILEDDTDSFTNGSSEPYEQHRK